MLILLSSCSRVAFLCRCCSFCFNGQFLMPRGLCDIPRPSLVPRNPYPLLHLHHSRGRHTRDSSHLLYHFSSLVLQSSSRCPSPHITRAAPVTRTGSRGAYWACRLQQDGPEMGRTEWATPQVRD